MWNDFKAFVMRGNVLDLSVVYCKLDVPLAASRCPHCTSQLAGARPAA